MQYISRARWGATPWRGRLYTVPWSVRTETLVHYHGAPPKVDRGLAVAREVEVIHLGNGWAGIGYNWLVTQAGEILEGRGWDLVGAHCPGHNRTGIGIYVAVGGDQVPTDDALRAVRSVRDEACRRAGRQLAMSWHGRDYPTECPGARLRAWVQGGMKITPPPMADHAGTGVRPRIPRVLQVADPLMRGDDVKAVQRVVGSAIDGWYGPDTARDVLRWQVAHGLDADGVVGPVTAAAMGLRWTGPTPGGVRA